MVGFEARIVEPSVARFVAESADVAMQCVIIESLLQKLLAQPRVALAPFVCAGNRAALCEYLFIFLPFSSVAR